MPQANSLEWYCEEALSQLVAVDTRLTGISRLHHSPDTASVLDAIVFKCELGAERLDGPGGNDATVSAIFGSASKTQEQLDDITAAIRESIYKRPSVVDLSALPFEFLSVEPECSLKRETGRKIRKNVLSVPLIAKLL